MYNNIKDKLKIVLFGLIMSLVFVPHAQAADVTIVGVGDMVCEFSDPSTSCRQMSRRLSNQTTIINPQYVLPLGDLQYVNGDYTSFTNIFNSDWGTHKSKMRPVPGNHEYHTSGAAGYYNYFGTLATGVNGKGYYSWTAGDWHMIALNSEVAISEQVTWLNSDLAANPSACTLAYFHRPRFSSGNNHGSDTTVAPFWEALYARGVDIVLSGHEHNYERFDLQNPSGVRDTVRGIREFVVGTGGRSFYGFSTPLTTSQFRRTGTGGVLKMVLHPTSYDYSFIDDNGNVVDSGSGQCIGTPNTTPNPTVAPTIAPTTPPAANYVDNSVCNPDRGSNVFTNNLTNQFFPLSSWTGPHTLRNSSNGEQVVMSVQSTTKAIPGADGTDPVQALILEEYETINGVHSETSYNWFGQVKPGFSGAGTVCYFGEDVTTYPDLGHGGSWQAGDPNARAGILLTPNPFVGQNWLIEDAAAYGAYEDSFVRGVNQNYSVPAGNFNNVIYIEEAGNTSTKRYAPGVGMIWDSGMVLINPNYSVPPTAIPTPTGSTNPSPTLPPIPCGPTNTGQVSMATNLPTGTYKIWARIQTSGSANNFLVKVDNTCSQITNSTGAGGWIWVSASQTVALNEPNQTVTLIGRDDGVKVDKVILTQDLLCVPSGFGQNCDTQPTPTPTDTPPGTTVNPTPVPTATDASPTPTRIPGDQNSGGTSIRLNPIADARVLDTSPDRNYGNQDSLRINGIPSGFYREVSKAYLMFDTSSLKDNVVSLKLRFYVRGGDSASSNTQTIKQVDNTLWTETGITYNNAPAMGRSLATFGPTRTNTWYEVSLPADALTVGQTRFALGIENCANCRDGLSISSRQSSQKPELIINGGLPTSNPGGGSDDDDDDNDDDD